MNLLTKGDNYDVKGVDGHVIVTQYKSTHCPYSSFQDCVSQYFATLNILNSMQTYDTFNDCLIHYINLYITKYDNVKMLYNNYTYVKMSRTMMRVSRINCRPHTVEYSDTISLAKMTAMRFLKSDWTCSALHEEYRSFMINTD